MTTTTDNRAIHSALFQLEDIPALDHQVLADAAWPSTEGRDVRTRGSAGASLGYALGYASASGVNRDTGREYHSSLASPHETAVKRLADADAELAKALGRSHVTSEMMGIDPFDIRRRCDRLTRALRGVLQRPGGHPRGVDIACKSIHEAHRALRGSSTRSPRPVPTKPAKKAA